MTDNPFMTDDAHRPDPPGSGSDPLDDARSSSTLSPGPGSSDPGPSPPGWGPTINTGLPASLLPGVSPWEQARSYGARSWSDRSSGAEGGGPAYRPYDPAVGPPWPLLVAVPGYVPPRLIRWPIYIGIFVLIAQFAGWLPSLH